MRHSSKCEVGFANVYKYKFQGQERQDELGLDWDSFKWRNYDYAIGRFMNIDPLTEQYNTWSPYAFSGNRVIDARELEGLEPYILFGSKDAAASNFSKLYNGTSIVENKEYVTKIYANTDSSGATGYSYAEPVRGTEAGATPASVALPAGIVSEAVAHTHGGYHPFYKNDEFSGTAGSSTSLGDMGYAERNSVDIYVATPNGSFQKYDYILNTIATLSTDMPSDPKHPSRLNTIDPIVPVSTLTPAPLVILPPPAITPTLIITP